MCPHAHARTAPDLCHRRQCTTPSSPSSDIVFSHSPIIQWSTIIPGSATTPRQVIHPRIHGGTATDADITANTTAGAAQTDEWNLISATRACHNSPTPDTSPISGLASGRLWVCRTRDRTTNDWCRTLCRGLRPPQATPCYPLPIQLQPLLHNPTATSTCMGHFQHRWPVGVQPLPPRKLTVV